MSHRLIYSDDSPSCIVCGAGWVDDASYEDRPSYCSGNTRQCHHYGDECPNGPDEPCQLDMLCTCDWCM